MEAAGQRVRTQRPYVPAGIALLAMAVSVMVLLSVACAGQPSKGEDSVEVKRVSGPGHVSLIVENRRAYDVTVSLKVYAHNASVVRIVPETSVYAGHSRTEAVRVSSPDSGQPWKWRYRFHWTKGSIDARHDANAVYCLPFEKGRAYRVCQGYNGRPTHRGPNQYAVDFTMPEGTTVCAARAGVVVDLKESSDVGGRGMKYADESNYVSIAHADGTIGEYHHLQADGVLVEIGDRVVAGQAIACSGNTGYSTFPHLHFGVYSAADAHRMQSHPITFATVEGIAIDPRPGRAYTAE